jgi:adenylate cyclase
MKKIFKKAFEYLNSTTTVGLLATAVVTSFAFTYYSTQNNLELQDQKHSFFYRLTELLDQKTLDTRFRLRGPFEGKERVAVLAIDDESLNQVGRWPWSRDKVATLIDRTMNEGAKTLGFDMVFSEPQIDKTVEVLSEIEQKQALPEELKMAFAEAKSKAQPDKAFAEVINKHREKLVLGAFFEENDQHFAPYQDLCYNEAFKRTDGYSIVENQEWPPLVFNDYYIRTKENLLFEDVPFKDYFTPIFEKIEKAASEKIITQRFNKSLTVSLTPAEQFQVDVAKQNSLASYCATWLTEKYDPYLPWWKDQWPKLFSKYPPLASLGFNKIYSYMQEKILTNSIPQKGRWTVNISELRKASAHNAMFNAFPDSDGTLRRSPLIYRSGLNYVPSLALQTYLISTGYQAHLSFDIDADNKSQFAVSKLEIKDPESDKVIFDVPVDHRGRLKINYAGPQMSYPHLSAAELFHDRPKIKIHQYLWDQETQQYNTKELLVDRKEFIKDRTFIIGATAIGVYDLRVTPYQEIYPGVETHVNLLANLMSQNFLRQHKAEFRYMMFILAGLGIFVSVLLHYLGAISGLIATFLIAAGIALVDRYLLFNNGIVASTAFPMIQVSLIYISMTFYKYLTEERKKKHLKATFSKYVSPAIVDEILKDPENINLGGRKQKMSVFFSDVRGFTTISEKLDPQVLSNVLNEYLTPMTNIVFHNKGTLDKYMGDAVMAFFGAPIFFPDHAKYACRCALQSIEKLKEIQKNFQERGLPVIDIGIGINTSDMSVGNMGSDIVRSYTVMGDGVNLGSRLEGINKEYGTRIIISEFTYQEVQSEFTCREVDWVRVKGKLQPIKIFELICEGAPNVEKQDHLNIYNEGYKLYREGRFAESLDIFKLALTKDPSDPVSQLYLERCQDYLAEAPPGDWDGVFIMKTK